MKQKVKKYNLFTGKQIKSDVMIDSAVGNPALHTLHKFDNINEKTVLSPYNSEHLDYIKYQIRYNYTSKIKYACKLDNNLFISTDMVSTFVNMRVFAILKSYEVEGDKSSLVFEYSYMKGQPKKYISKVANFVFNTSTAKDTSVFISYILSEIKEVFYELSVLINDFQSLEHSLFGYIAAYKKYLWFRTALDEPVITMQDTPFEMNRKLEAIKDNLTKSDIHPLSDLMTMGVKNNPAQSAAFLCYGFTPNWNDINHCRSVIMGGYLNGFRTMKDFFLNDNNGRIATIKGKADVKEPGVLGKEVTTAVSSERINSADKRKVVHDCKNRWYFPITINDKKDLEFYRFKYYYDTKTHKRLGYIDIDREDLIGQDLNIRTIMTCECNNQICEECFGYNAKICQDADIQKFEAYIYVSSLVSQKMQGVISVKHHLAAKLAPMIISYGDTRDMELEQFIKKFDIIDKMEFDILHFNKKHSIRFENYDVDNTKDIPEYEKHVFPIYESGNYGRLYIDDIEFETIEALKRIDDYTYQISIPNISVISDANDLIEALRKHGAGAFNKGDEFANKSIIDQLMIVYNFIKSRLSLPSFIYYEVLVHGLTVDSADVSSKVKSTTNEILFVTSKDVNNKSKNRYVHPNIAEGLVHGLFERALSYTGFKTNPTPFDIVYAHIKDRDGRFYNIPKELNRIIGEEFPDIED